MKNRIYLLITIICGSLTSFAQTTVTSPNSARFVLMDTVAEVMNNSAFQAFAKAETDATWDFSSAQYNGTSVTYTRYQASSTTFTDADYSTDIFYPFSSALKYSLKKYYSVSANNLVSKGEEVEVTQTIPLSALTGNASDELVFPAQDIVYSEDEVLAVYPMNVNDTWTSTNTRSTNFNITVSAFALNNTPGVRKTTRTVTDSVVGWGTAKILAFYGGSTFDNSVLQIRRRITLVDSFFLGGNPAPTALLTAFGLEQGGVTTANECLFVRQDEIEELVRMEYGESDFTTVETVNVHQNRLEGPAVSVKDVNVNSNMMVYPNPVMSDYLTVQLSNEVTQAHSFQLVDMFGRAVMEGQLDGNAIELSGELANGTYFLKTSTNDSELNTQKVVIQR